MHFNIPLPDLQISLFERLRELRSTYLLEALLATVASADIETVDQELQTFVPKASLRKVAGWGLRGELLFPVPSLLSKKPQLIGYYRLLLGFSQKQLYGKTHGIGPFRSMEVKGLLNDKQKHSLPDLCRCLCSSADHFVQAIDHLSQNAVHELTLLTLGTQLRGGALNRIGQKATREVFEIIKAIVAEHTVETSTNWIAIQSAAAQPIRIAFAADPDIAIRAELPSGKLRPIIAIEIKGGRDVSNVHNRIGEAEKSHQKARKHGFTECWTIVGVTKLDRDLAHRESPSTDMFFLLQQLNDSASTEFQNFKEQLHSRLGISD